MRNYRRRRINPVSWYIGSGNISEVFNRRSKSPFVRVKEIYGEELERLHTDSEYLKLPAKKLTLQQRLAIRNHVKTQMAKERKNNYVIGVVIFLVFFIALFIIKNLPISIFKSG